MASSSRFIVLEGIDGSGTTTQAAKLSTHYDSRGFKVVSTCEPSGGHIGQLIRSVLKAGPGSADTVSFEWSTLALLFAADRMDHLRRVVEPALAQGALVISDRYRLSSFVYQSMTAPEPERALRWVREINQHSRAPDLTVVLDLDAEVAEARRSRRGASRELFEVRELQQRLAEAYRRAELFAPEDNIVHVSADGPEGEVFSRILGAIEGRMPGLGL